MRFYSEEQWDVFVYVRFTSWRLQVQGPVIPQEGSGCSGSFLCCKYDWPSPLSSHTWAITHIPQSFRLKDYCGIRISWSQGASDLSSVVLRRVLSAWPDHSMSHEGSHTTPRTCPLVSIVYPTAQAYIAHWFQIYLNSNIYGFDFQQGHSVQPWGWAPAW